MKNKLLETFFHWPSPYIRESDFAVLLNTTDNARYSVIKRALKAGYLTHVCRSMYLVNYRQNAGLVDPFELSLLLYGPSYVSCESALSFHGWIPEATYTTTLVCTKRSKEIATPLGIFSYKHTPPAQFLVEVKRYSNDKSSALIANPWKAIADIIYTTRREWKSATELSADLRIDMDLLCHNAKESLAEIIRTYESKRTKIALQTILETLP